MRSYLGRQLERAEGVILAERARGVPCALHALADLTPTPPGAELWEGGCFECGRAIFYHSEPGTPERETQVHRELYRVGVKSVALGSSRRYIAWLAWLWRQPPRQRSVPPRDPYVRALDDETNRRCRETWTAFWQSPPPETLEWREFFAEDFPLNELEAIVWPPREDHGDNLATTT